MKAQVKQHNKQLSDSEKVIDNLQCQLREEHVEHFPVKEGKRYCVDVRMCIYHELLCDVPVSHCGNLIAVFLRIFDRKIMEKIPSPATCAQMAYELGVLSTIHMMDFMTQQKNLCLSWDATTIDGCHINELHLTANKVNCLVVDIRHLPGGKAVDYVAHIMSSLSEAAATYAKYKGLSPVEVLRTLKASISSTLTDRAAVNACVTRQLCDELDTQLMLLNCNVHPLDSVARAAKTNLIQVDTKHSVRGNCFGSEGSAANLISAISVLRFKDGTGDPLGFKNFLHQHDLLTGTVVRYVGNQIHVLFHLAGLVVLHKDKLLDFIENECCAAAQFRSSISRDLKNDKILTQVWALAVLGKVLTGPWMTKFYSSTMSNLEIGPFVQHCVSTLKYWLEDPNLVVQPTKDAFGEQLDPCTDDVLSSLLEFSAEEEVQMDALKSVLSGALTVLERQMVSFWTGDFSNPTSTDMERSASAPSHNMASERTLGCFDKMWRRAPNATLGFINGKVRFKMNKVIEWLESKDGEEKRQLVNFAVSEARDERVKEVIKRQKLVSDVNQRRKDVSVQRQKSAKNAFVKQITEGLKQGTANNVKCPDGVKARIAAYIENPLAIVGNLILHSVDSCQWYGRIQHVNETKSKLTVGYWTMNEPESNSVDFSISVASFYAEAAIGHLVFI